MIEALLEGGPRGGELLALSGAVPLDVIRLPFPLETAVSADYPSASPIGVALYRRDLSFALDRVPGLPTAALYRYERSEVTP